MPTQYIQFQNPSLAISFNGLHEIQRILNMSESQQTQEASEQAMYM